MKHRRVAVEKALMMIGIPKIPKMKPFLLDKRKCARWARNRVNKH